MQPIIALVLRAISDGADLIVHANILLEHFTYIAPWEVLPHDHFLFQRNAGRRFFLGGPLAMLLFEEIAELVSRPLNRAVRSTREFPFITLRTRRIMTSTVRMVARLSPMVMSGAVSRQTKATSPLSRRI